MIHISINITNMARPFEVNSSIVEWDMKRAGPSLIKELGLLPMEEIERLELLPKNECDIAIGKMQIKNTDFSKALDKAFTDAMNIFLDANNIDKDLDVISIKKDACFVINKKVTQSSFGRYIKFIPKNQYHAYMNVKPFEFYFKRNGEIDIKGLVGDKKRRSEIIKLHEDGMINFLFYIIELAEKTNLSSKQMNKFLHDFVEMYKRKELEFDYYREFNVESRFRYQFAGAEAMADYIDESMLQKVDIRYNYIHLILPIINLLV